MAAGFICYTDDGHLQITDKQVYFRLEAKASFDATTTGWSQYGNQGGSYRDIIFNGPSLTDAPMLALSSSAGTWAKLIASSTGSLTYRITRKSAAVVDMYLFSARRPPATGGCFRLFDDNGVCIVNDAYPIARPLGMVNASGYSGISLSGRKAAHVPQKQETSSYNIYTSQGLGSCTFNGQPAYQITNTTGWSEGQCIATTGSASGTNLTSVVGPVNYQCMQTNQPPLGSSYSSAEWSSLIIDVTGL
ncbi:hypothetical protein WBP07_12855 [Novosphingobium sp. BL-8A]|uniref:hypothetical protein n=1 Tax=Novosphingobium sp. BL-8A TaxID=3127639 RepID=UPI003757C8A9